MSASHTPGPWVPTMEHDLSIYGDWDDEDALTVSATKVLRGGDGELAIVVIDMNFPNTWDDDLLDANARLIAAAPDLLAFTQSLADRDDSIGDDARAAIAKATGAM